MDAIHIFSSAPYFAKNPDKALYMDKFDIYNTVLSALSWRKYNGKIKLVCDKAGADFFKELRITDIWNQVSPSLADDLEGINPKMFWAAGKLLALRDEKKPVVVIDTDFVVWKKLDFFDNIIVAHFEDLNPDIYPSPSVFMLNNYTFLDGLDYSLLPSNTAFLYIPDLGFKHFYTNQAISFMKSAIDTDDYLCPMIFAEQRLLTMTAKLYEIPVTTLLNKDMLFFPQDNFTHLWGAKQVMRDNPDLHIEFWTRCKNKIKSDFADYLYLIDSIEKHYIHH